MQQYNLLASNYFKFIIMKYIRSYYLDCKCIHKQMKHTINYIIKILVSFYVILCTIMYKKLGSYKYFKPALTGDAEYLFCIINWFIFLNINILFIKIYTIILVFLCLCIISMNIIKITYFMNFCSFTH